MDNSFQAPQHSSQNKGQQVIKVEDFIQGTVKMSGHKAVQTAEEAVTKLCPANPQLSKPRYLLGTDRGKGAAFAVINVYPGAVTVEIDIRSSLLQG